MTKIIHILPHNLEDFMAGGYENFDHHSVRFIERVNTFWKMKHGEQIEQELWILTTNAKMKEFFHTKGFRVRLFPVSLALPLPLEISFSLLKAVWREKKEKGTIWHLHSYYLFMNDLISVLLAFKKAKFVVHHRGGGPSWTSKAFLYTIYHYVFGLRLTLRLAQCVFVQNHDEERRLKNFLKLKNHKVMYFPNTVSEKYIRENQGTLYRGSEGNNTKMIVAGRIEKILFSSGLEAIDHVLSQHDRFSLEVVGLKRNIEELEKLSSKYQNRIQLTGWLGRTELLDRLRNSNIFFHINNKDEGSPMALIEAQSQGLPAIGFDIDGVRDIIRHGYNGFLIKDIHELDHIIDKISDDSKLLKTMSEHSRRNIKEYFIDEIYFPHLIHIYSSL